MVEQVNTMTDREITSALLDKLDTALESPTTVSLESVDGILSDLEQYIPNTLREQNPQMIDGVIDALTQYTRTFRSAVVSNPASLKPVYDRCYTPLRRWNYTRLLRDRQATLTHIDLFPGEDRNRSGEHVLAKNYANICSDRMERLVDMNFVAQHLFDRFLTLFLRRVRQGNVGQAERLPILLKEANENVQKEWSDFVQALLAPFYDTNQFSITSNYQDGRLTFRIAQRDDPAVAKVRDTTSAGAAQAVGADGVGADDEGEGEGEDPTVQLQPRARNTEPERGVRGNITVLGEDNEDVALLNSENIITSTPLGKVGIACARGNKGGPNEDKVLCELRNGTVQLAVADGVGGGKSGYKASASVMEAIANHEDPNEALQNAMEQMRTESLVNSASTVAIARIQKDDRGQRILRTFSVGDSKVLVIRNGKVEFGSTEDLFYPVESEKVQVDYGNPGTPNIIEVDLEGYLAYHPRRNGINVACGIGEHGELMINLETDPRKFTDFSLQPGDWVMVMSDGLTDNFTPDEIIMLTSKCNTPQQIITVLSEALQNRLENINIKEGSLKAVERYVMRGDITKENIGHTLELIKARERPIFGTMTTINSDLASCILGLRKISNPTDLAAKYKEDKYVIEVVERAKKAKRGDLPEWIKKENSSILIGRWILGCFVDGYQCQPKQDNVALAVMLVE
jgi:serine/threonine protein phosphatase PrpC